MSDLPYLIGERRAVPDARGNWTPLPAYEGWVPQEPRSLTACGIGLTLIFTALAAWIAAGLTGAF